MSSLVDVIADAVGFFCVGLLVGLWIGERATSSRWMRNADEIWRIECRGRLFKVLHDGDYTPRVIGAIETSRAKRSSEES